MDEILNRIKVAIEFLNEGIPFKVGDLYFGIDQSNVFNVTASTRSIDLKKINKSSVLLELDDIKSIFTKMKKASFELENFCKNKSIKFNIDYDYGMGDIRICSEENDVINWEYDVRS